MAYALSIFLVIILAVVSFSIPAINNTFDCEKLEGENKKNECQELQTQGWTFHAILVPVLMGALVITVIIETKSRKKHSQSQANGSEKLE